MGLREIFKESRSRRMSDLTSFEQEVGELIIAAVNLDISVDAITPEQPLFREGLGLDSIDMLEIALAISKKYGFQLKSDDRNNAEVFSSLRALAAHIALNRKTS